MIVCFEEVPEGVFSFEILVSLRLIWRVPIRLSINLSTPAMDQISSFVSTHEKKSASMIIMMIWLQELFPVGLPLF